jgi:hypothetical protein
MKGYEIHLCKVRDDISDLYLSVQTDDGVIVRGDRYYQYKWIRDHTFQIYIKEQWREAMSIDFDFSITDGFSEWVRNSYSVIKNPDGTYSTQCAQWKNRLSWDDLKDYFIKEYHG